MRDCLILILKHMETYSLFSDQINKAIIIIIQTPIMIKSLIHQMKGNQFPFAQLVDPSVDIKKMLVKKRIAYRNSNQYGKIKEKIEKLKTVGHKNTINLRSTEDNGNGFIDLYYPYVNVRLQDSFLQNSSQTVKQLHKQFIELAIYLAKNYILTSFSPERCGVIINEGKNIIKYFLPLNQIIITTNISMLQRSVQLFNLQSMHYLDTLCQSALNTTLQNSSQRSFKHNTQKSIQLRKLRKESQPVVLNFNSRKLSANPLSKQMRKLSHLSKQLSQFSQMRKRKKESTRNSAGSFCTLKNLMRQDSERDLFKSYLSESKLINQRVLKLKQRSQAAIRDFAELQRLMASHRSVSNLIQRIRS